MNSVLTTRPETSSNAIEHSDEKANAPMKRAVDVCFSADVETDGPIPGPFSIFSFALVFAGKFDGTPGAPPFALFERWDSTALSSLGF